MGMTRALPGLCTEEPGSGQGFLPEDPDLSDLWQPAGCPPSEATPHIQLQERLDPSSKSPSTGTHPDSTVTPKAVAWLLQPGSLALHGLSKGWRRPSSQKG